MVISTSPASAVSAYNHESRLRTSIVEEADDLQRQITCRTGKAVPNCMWAMLPGEDFPRDDNESGWLTRAFFPSRRVPTASLIRDSGKCGEEITAVDSAVKAV